MIFNDYIIILKLSVADKIISCKEEFGRQVLNPKIDKNRKIKNH